MSKTPWVSVAIGLLFASWASAASSSKFTFTSRTISPEDIHSPYLNMAVHWQGREDSQPEGLKGAPANLPETASFFVVHLGGNEVFMLVVPAKSPKLYVDTDLDKDLSDEKPVIGKRLRSGTIPGPGTAYHFPALPTPTSQPGEKTNAKIQVALFGSDYVIVAPTSYCSGTVEIKGKRYRVRLADANYNGRYDDVIQFGRRMKDAKRDDSSSPNYDSLAIDLNGDGQFSMSSDASAEVIPLPKMLRFGDDYYAFKVAANGLQVTVEKTTPKFGTLDVGHPDAELLLWSETGVHYLKASGGKWKLPEGNYSCYMVRVTTADPKKNKYTLTCRRNTGKLTDFDVVEGKTTSFKIGPPLTAQAKVNLRREMFRRTAVISALVVGQEGEEYLAGAQKNAQMLPAPDIKILDSGGKVVESGKLEYG